MRFLRGKDAGADKEKTLKMLEDRMAAIELAGDGIGIAESDGRLSFVNRAFAEAYGYGSWQSLISRVWMNLCGDETQKVLAGVLPVLTTGGCWTGTGEGVRKDGTNFRTSISISALPGQRWILVIRDVSGQIKTEELAVQRLAAIEAAGDGIGIVDPQGNLVYMNRALKALHEFDEYEAQDRIGRSWTGLYTEIGQEQIRNTVMPALKERGYWKGDSPILTRSGRIVYAEMSLTLLPDGGLIGTAWDITDRIKAEYDRVELEKKFYQAQKMEAVGRLAGGIAHDFNNILAAIMGYADFLIEDLPADSKEFRYARSIRDGGAQARDVVDRLLMFSRTQDHEMEIMDLQGKVEETVSLLRSTVPSTIRLELDAGDGPAAISGNRTLISQALMNLCVNACDAIGDEHGSVHVRIDKEVYAGLSPDYHVLGELEKGRLYYVLSIADDGCGMSGEVMERIFDPFFTTKPVDQGTGLGLSSVHGIMVSHQGAVAVRSRIGQGTEFALFFPVAGDELQEEIAGDFALSAAIPHAGAKVLVVDDQDDVRAMMAEMLERMGYAVKTFGAADPALEELVSRPKDYALVLTDQTMPGMTGCELAQAIVDKFPVLPVILMSGFSAENLGALTAGIPSIRAILHKPVKRADLTKVVAQALAGVKPFYSALQTTTR